MLDHHVVAIGVTIITDQSPVGAKGRGAFRALLTFATARETASQEAEHEFMSSHALFR